MAGRESRRVAVHSVNYTTALPGHLLGVRRCAGQVVVAEYIDKTSVLKSRKCRQTDKLNKTEREQ